MTGAIIAMTTPARMRFGVSAARPPSTDRVSARTLPSVLPESMMMSGQTKEFHA